MSKQAVAATLVEQKDNQRLVALAIFAVGVYFLLCVPAYAGAIAAVLCSVINSILIDVGRGIATLAVIVLGISALLGRATWAQGLTIMAGIAIIFGAPSMALSFAAAAITGSDGLGTLLGQGGGFTNLAAVLTCNVGTR